MAQIRLIVEQTSFPRYWCWPEGHDPDVIFFGYQMGKDWIRTFEDELNLFLSLEEVVGIFFIEGEATNDNIVIEILDSAIKRSNRSPIRLYD